MVNIKFTANQMKDKQLGLDTKSTDEWEEKVKSLAYSLSPQRYVSNATIRDKAAQMGFTVNGDIIDFTKAKPQTIADAIVKVVSVEKKNIVETINQALDYYNPDRAELQRVEVVLVNTLQKEDPTDLKWLIDEMTQKGFRKLYGPMNLNPKKPNTFGYAFTW